MNKRVPLKLNGLPIGWAEVEYDVEREIYYIIDMQIEEAVYPAELFESVNGSFSILEEG